jgi:L-threonylcarbamoyladenylate synthase
MNTSILRVDQNNPKPDEVMEGARVLNEGGLVIFPTETVYGIGCNAFSGKSALKVFKVKRRPADNPLIVHINSIDMLRTVAKDIPEVVERRWREFWPGPLTIIFEATDKVPVEVRGGLSTVAVRMPDNHLALSLIEKSGIPIAAPSANISTRPSITSSRDAIEEFSGSVDLIYDAGDTEYGLESSVISLNAGHPKLLRAGSMMAEDIAAIFGELEVDDVARGLAYSIKPISPGTKYKHYSPQKPLVLVSGDHIFRAIFDRYSQDDRLLFIGIPEKIKGSRKNLIFLGSGNRLIEVGKNLFRSFRDLDRSPYKVGVIHDFPEDHEGLAIMNRIRKASTVTVSSEEDFKTFLESI